jgi:uncharacterized DUF497 family protein
MSPEFDPKKNAANLAKHGISLASGDGVLYDPEEIRLISVRPATPKERKSYEK